MGHEQIACPDCGTIISFTARKLKDVEKIYAKDQTGLHETALPERHKSVDCPQCEANVVVRYSKKGWLP